MGEQECVCSRGQVDGNHPNNNNNSNQQQNKRAYRGISRKSPLSRAAVGSRTAADRVTTARALFKVVKVHDNAEVFGSREESSVNASLISSRLCLESLAAGHWEYFWKVPQTIGKGFLEGPKGLSESPV